jgi:5-methylcytosine-specific restriction enzyme A
MKATPSSPAKADWCRDELILALDVYFRLAGAVPGPRRPEILDLSTLLRSAGLHLASDRRPNFRSPASVVMKLMNFRSIDPDYGGKGLAAGGRLDREVWQELAVDRQRLSKTAAAIRAVLSEGSHASFASEPGDTLTMEAEEGALLTRLHLFRDRSARLVETKKRAAIESTGRLVCEVCSFCFESTYGSIGDGYIECHHRKPLSELRSKQRTSLDDLALVCANCHRMMHARRPWVTIEQLRAIVAGHNKTGEASSDK